MMRNVYFYNGKDTKTDHQRKVPYKNTSKIYGPYSFLAAIKTISGVFRPSIFSVGQPSGQTVFTIFTWNYISDLHFQIEIWFHTAWSMKHWAGQG